MVLKSNQRFFFRFCMIIARYLLTVKKHTSKTNLARKLGKGGLKHELNI
jgi:hypothetical protein